MIATETKAGAERLAADIRAFWKARGYQPLRLRKRRVPLSYRREDYEIWEIRSNMKNGQPV